MHNSHYDIDRVSEIIEVDEKIIMSWLARGQIPYRTIDGKPKIHGSQFNRMRQYKQKTQTKDFTKETKKELLQYFQSVGSFLLSDTMTPEGYQLLQLTRRKCLEWTGLELGV